MGCIIYLLAAGRKIPRGLSASSSQTVAVSLKAAERTLVFEREIPALERYETVAVEFQAEGLFDKTDTCSLRVKSGATYLPPVFPVSSNRN